MCVLDCVCVIWASRKLAPCCAVSHCPLVVRVKVRVSGSHLLTQVIKHHKGICGQERRRGGEEEERKGKERRSGDERIRRRRRRGEGEKGGGDERRR